jgi:hypothetical protein
MTPIPAHTIGGVRTQIWLDLQEAMKGAGHRFSYVLYAALMGMVAVFCFASVDNYLPTDLTLMLNTRFIEGASVFSGYLSYFDFLVIIVSILLLERYRPSFFGSKLALRFLFIVAVLTVLLDLVNPNDESPKQLGLPLLANLPAYIFLLFMAAVFFMREEGFLFVMRRVGRIVGIALTIRAAMLLLLWLAGKGNYKFGGVNSALTEGDSLLVYAFAATMLFASLLIRKRFWPFVAWVLCVLVEILSFRRSALFVLLGAHAFTLVFHMLLKRRVASMVKNVLLASLVLGVVAFAAAQVIPNDTLQFYMNRYFGMFLGMGQSERDTYAGDSGHFDESASTMEYAFYKMEFWGYGGGSSDRINIPGATLRLWVHNVYAATWLYRGIYALLFYGLLGFVLLLMLMKVIVKRRFVDPAYSLIVGAAIASMIMLMVAWYSNPVQIAESLRMRVLWVSVLALIFRLTPENVATAFPAMSRSLQTGQRHTEPRRFITPRMTTE